MRENEAREGKQKRKETKKDCPWETIDQKKVRSGNIIPSM